MKTHPGRQNYNDAHEIYHVQYRQFFEVGKENFFKASAIDNKSGKNA
jgi:hypothetical protein